MINIHYHFFHIHFSMIQKLYIFDYRKVIITQIYTKKYKIYTHF